MKKQISLFIIIILLILPFSMLLNVRAEGVTITTDPNTTYAGGELVTNTGTITVYDVNTNTDGSASDTFNAYKIVDIYYNRTTNEMKYKFTTAFQTFLTSINSQLNIDSYFNLTSDYTISESIKTTSTLNVLVSQYATYIRLNNISGAAMTNSNIGNNSSKLDAQLTNASAGSYVILPSSVNELENISNDNYFQIEAFTYGVMVSNLNFSVDNGNWILPNATIQAKRENSHISGLLNSNVIANFLVMTPMEQAAVIASFDKNLNAYVNKDMTILIRNGILNSFDDSYNYPTNTHSSILNNQTIADRLGKLTITVPEGITIDFSEIYETQNFTKLTFDSSDNRIYDNSHNLVGEVSNNGRTITFTNYWAITLQIKISNNHNFTAGSPIEIDLEGYYLKEPYKDIGTNPTEEQINSVLDKIEVTATIYTYGLRVNNTNSSNNNLSGGVFQAYSDSNCTAGNEIGPQITVNNGVGSFVGISGEDTIYLKQITAPSGYKLVNEPIEIDPNNITLGADNYYEVTVVNQANATLPFTGGIGTTIYICCGIIIAVGAIILLVLYKKKKK